MTQKPSHEFDTGKLKQKAARRTHELHEKAQQETVVHGHKMEKGDIFKFVGLIAFFAIMVLICLLIWPYVADIFEPGGIDRVIAVGEYAHGIADAAHESAEWYPDAESAVDAARAAFTEGSVLLCKASHSMHLEKIVEELLKTT